MSELRPICPAATGKPRRAGRIVLLGILLVLSAGSGPARAAAPVHTYQLRPGVVAQVRSDGGLWIGTGPGRPALLEILPLETGAASRRTRGRNVPPFTAQTFEGAAAGQRGFSSRRDDDNDGAVDEDRLDGQDNDGDGAVDEDFAAVSEDMVVVDFHDGGRFEYYHWTYPSLDQVVFLNATVADGRIRCDLGTVPWRQVLLATGRHDATGRGRVSDLTAFVGRVPRADGPTAANGVSDDCDPSNGLWIGVAFLERESAKRVVNDGALLDVFLPETPMSVAVGLARTRLQLAQMLETAQRVREGVMDKVSGRRAPWIVPPLCARCRQAEPPTFNWWRDEDDRLHLAADLAAGAHGVFDPDLFRIGETPLGVPETIHWQPASGPGETLVWACDRRGGISDPWRALAAASDHESVGRLEFVFPRSEAAAQLVPGGGLHGVYRDGRVFTAALRNTPTPLTAESLADTAGAGSPVADPDDLLRAGNQQPTLAPKLLEGFPNPFQDVIRLRFEVPATMGEAFVWKGDEGPPAGLDLRAAVPWKSGQPQVSVKIYSVNGQELVTLFAGSLGAGDNVVTWSGTDNYGRKVSSGTYFCKLQLDDWSVTRRLVYLR